MSEDRARAHYDAFVRLLRLERAAPNLTPDQRLSYVFDALDSLRGTVEYLLLRQRERPDEHRRVLLAFAGWLTAQHVVLGRLHNGNGGAYVRVEVADLVDEFLAISEGGPA